MSLDLTSQLLGDVLDGCELRPQLIAALLGECHVAGEVPRQLRSFLSFQVVAGTPVTSVEQVPEARPG